MLVGLQWLRARRTPTRLEATGPVGHAVNLAVFLALYLPEPTSDATLLFYGASMWLSALRGYAGCEVLAVSNWLLGRDDQVGCALFWPIDQLEHHRAGQRPGLAARWAAATRAEPRDGGGSVGTSPDHRGAVRPGLSPLPSDAGAGGAGPPGWASTPSCAPA